MKKQHSLFNIKSSIKSAEQEVLQQEIINKISSKKSKSISKETSTDDIHWQNTLNSMPKELMPLIFNTEHKDIVTGYRVHNDWITDTPYFLNKFKKLHGYIEWQYISNCKNLDNCPNGFPQCNFCEYKNK